MNIHVVIATAGRPEIVARTVSLLAGQSRRADRVLVIGASPADVASVRPVGPDLSVHVAPARGLCAQRNHGLRLSEGEADLVVFLDDDFVAADDFLASVEALFTRHADIVGATGRVIADGVTGTGFTVDEGLAMVRSDRPGLPEERPRVSLYGCNMVIRMSAAAGMSFDEELPLYGWQEDVDFTYRLARRGRLVWHSSLRGVHLGVKGGRTAGVRLGYSQVANILYLRAKGTIPRKAGWRLMLGNVAMNVARSLWSEPHIDRRGRLKGNLLAVYEFLRGRMHPKRILQL
jgi:GT2 family glycosyltransferase